MANELFPVVCPSCRGGLFSSAEGVSCSGCGTTYGFTHGAADFAPNEHYDRFSPDQTLSAREIDGLRLEVEGSRRRIEDFYAPHMRSSMPHARRVLDCGCGNGISVEALIACGYDAWGIDLSELRAWQWRERTVRERLLMANALRLPFPDAYFDVVIASGVVEHIGVSETVSPRYSVRTLPNRDEERVAFLTELQRVLAPGGSIFIDCPNGAFPVDFWHGNVPGEPRWHPPTEGFLPRFRDIRSMARLAIRGARVRAISPYRRLQFKQAARHRYGKVLAPFATWFFRVMTLKPMEWIAGTWINPYLVVQIVKPRG